MGKWRDKSLKGSDYFKIGLGLAAAGTGLGAAGVGPMAGLFSTGAGAASAGASGVAAGEALAGGGVAGMGAPMASIFGPSAKGAALLSQFGGAAATPMLSGAGAAFAPAASAFAPLAGEGAAALGAMSASTPLGLPALGEGAGLGSQGLFGGASMKKMGKALNGYSQFSQLASQQPAAAPLAPRPPQIDYGSFTDTYRKKKPQPGDPDYLIWMLTHGNG